MNLALESIGLIAASRAKSSGSERLPAIRPMDSSARFMRFAAEINNLAAGIQPRFHVCVWSRGVHLA
jgi:hypothetical protein